MLQGPTVRNVRTLEAVVGGDCTRTDQLMLACIYRYQSQFITIANLLSISLARLGTFKNIRRKCNTSTWFQILNQV